MDHCQMTDCPTKPTQRLSLYRKGQSAVALDLCDFHLRSCTEKAKEGSYSVCPLSHIRSKISSCEDTSDGIELQ
jgi:hypothetical protein